MDWYVTFDTGHSERVRADSYKDVEVLFAGFPVTSIQPLYTTSATALDPLWIIFGIALLMWFTRKTK